MSLVTRSILLASVFGLVATACSQGEIGTPTPVTNTAAPASSASPTPPSTAGSSSSGNSLASFDSCQALTSVATQFKLTEIKEVARQECGAEYGSTSGVSVSIKAWPDLKIQDVKGGPNAEFSNTTVGARAARIVKKAFTSSDCAVAVQVTPTSRVDFIASANASLDDACAAATALATAVEPTLPK